MVFSFLKKLMGGGQRREANSPAVSASASSDSPGETLREFVDFVVKALVDAPEKVTVSLLERGKATTIQIACEKRDIGKIIGKSGKTIAAIRALVNGAAGRYGQRVNVEVLD